MATFRPIYDFGAKLDLGGDSQVYFAGPSDADISSVHISILVANLPFLKKFLPPGTPYFKNNVILPHADRKLLI